MGTRGPIPKRKDQLNGHRSRDERETAVTAPGAEKVSKPRADPDWHPIASRLWESLGRSGQSRFYEPSDWAVAYSLMDDLSYYKSSSKRSGQMLATIMSAMSSLLVTEGDRRRVQIELARPNADDSEENTKVAVMDKWRQKLG